MQICAHSPPGEINTDKYWYGESSQCNRNVRVREQRTKYDEDIIKILFYGYIYIMHIITKLCVECKH